MREIKFRVFDKKIGKIFKAHDLRFTAEEAIYEVCHDTIRDDGGKHWEFTDFKEVVLMQYTGLKDKNGKEIYEGDIVTDGVGKFKIVYDLKLAGYQPYCIFRDDPENYCEVLGNITENPELLENKLAD